MGVGRGHILLAGISFLLAFHSLVVSNFLPSSLFLIVSFCWLWVATSVLFDRLEAASTMAITTTALLVVFAVSMQLTTPGSVDPRAFYFLGMFPALTAWICVCLFIRHLQKTEDVTDINLSDWFDEQEAEQTDLDLIVDELGQAFTETMVGLVFHDNESSPYRGTKIAHPSLKAAS